MDADDLEPKNVAPKLKNLEELSIEALGEYIVELEGEVERVRGEIALKQAAQASADDVFKR